MKYPKITPGNPATYNRKYRRALSAIWNTQLTGKQQWARLSNLIGRRNWPGHEALVTQLMVAES